MASKRKRLSQPDFSTPIAIDQQRSFTARFDSYDQRNDDIYYMISVQQSDRDPVSFMAQVGMYWAGDDWTSPAFVQRLQQELHTIAARGVSNTAYTGAMLPRR